MKKSFEVMVVFRFNGVDGVDTEDADKIVQELTDATEDWQIEHGADAVWVEDAILYETDTGTQLEAWDELWTNQEKESDK
jgi:hypothetical protein